jgi:hypothetical protein
VAAALEFRHVDVFTSVPFAGNGLIVLFGSPAGLAAKALIALTAEMRQCELIMAGFRPGASEDLHRRGRAAVRRASRHRRRRGTTRTSRPRCASTIVGLRDRRP